MDESTLPSPDLLRLMQVRRSVRRFLPQPIPPDMLDRVLEAASWAPSAHNRQPWRFAVLSSLEAREHLADAMGVEFYRDLSIDGMAPEDARAQVYRSRQRIVQASVAILICLDISAVDSCPENARGQAEYTMAVQSVALAGGQLLLAAHAVGLGGVWMCAPLFAPQAARQVLDLPVEWQPQALILLGYPAQIPPLPPRRPLSEITLFF